MDEKEHDDQCSGRKTRSEVEEAFENSQDSTVQIMNKIDLLNPDRAVISPLIVQYST